MKKERIEWQVIEPSGSCTFMCPWCRTSPFRFTVVCEAKSELPDVSMETICRCGECGRYFMFQWGTSKSRFAARYRALEEKEALAYIL